MSNPTLQVLVLERRNPALNMARFYVLSVEPTLFGDAALVREWGRIGRRGRRRLDLYEDRVKAAEALEDWLRRKSRRGYAVREPRLSGRSGGPAVEARTPKSTSENAPSSW